MTKELIQNYTRRISESSSTEIIVILYELCERYIDDAIDAGNRLDHEELKNQCGNAQKVINDLIGAIDFTYELAMPLYRIYEYISKEVGLAVIRNNTANLAKCKEFIKMLRLSFEQVAKSDTSGPVMDNAQSVYAGLTYGKGVLNESVAGIDQNRGFTV